MGPIEKEGPQAAHLRPTTTATAHSSARARRIRRLASRELDALLGVTPLLLVDRGDWWRDCGMHMGFPERNRAGRELLAASRA